jgi:hypothetical protein
MSRLERVGAALLVGATASATTIALPLDTASAHGGQAAAASEDALSRGSARAVLDVLARQFSDGLPDPDYDRRVDQVWALAEGWVVSYLDANPTATAEDVAADLAALLRSPDGEEDRFRPTAVSLAAGENATFVVTLNWDWAGMFFVVVRRPSGCFEVAWRITDLARNGTGLKDDLERWATYKPGFHDGALAGRAITLPPDAHGRPRFCIDATTLPSIGENRPGQVSIWVWTGDRALPVFSRIYQLNYETWSVMLEGDTLNVRVNEEYACFFACGSCVGPLGTWRLRVGPDRVDDLGTTPDEPELQLIDELLHRLASRLDARDLAADGVVKLLAPLMPALHPETGCFAGMIGSWRVDREGAISVVHFFADEVGAVDFTIEPRDGRPYVAGAALCSTP